MKQLDFVIFKESPGRTWILKLRYGGYTTIVCQEEGVKSYEDMRLELWNEIYECKALIWRIWCGHKLTWGPRLATLPD